MSFIPSSVRCSKRESKRSKSSRGTSSLMTAVLILDVQLLLGQSIAVTSPSVIFAETCEVIQSLQCTCSQGNILMHFEPGKERKQISQSKKLSLKSFSFSRRS